MLKKLLLAQTIFTSIVASTPSWGITFQVPEDYKDSTTTMGLIIRCEDLERDPHVRRPATKWKAFFASRVPVVNGLATFADLTNDHLEALGRIFNQEIIENDVDTENNVEYQNKRNRFINIMFTDGKNIQSSTITELNQVQSLNTLHVIGNSIEPATRTWNVEYKWDQ